MKQKLLCLLLVCCMASALAVPAFADEYGAEAVVTFEDGSLNEDYSGAANVTDMQPGDTLVQTFLLENKGDGATNWYLASAVVDALESNNTASGGAYSYVLTYDSGSETRELYNSLVGGEEQDGLSSATQGLEDFVLLGEIEAGETATVTLNIGLDGFTQRNAYQDTSAQVKMNFAVEEVRDATRTTVVTSVKTGDWMQTLPFILLTALSGLALVGFAVISLRKSRKNEGGE